MQVYDDVNKNYGSPSDPYDGQYQPETPNVQHTPVQNGGEPNDIAIIDGPSGTAGNGYGNSGSDGYNSLGGGSNSDSGLRNNNPSGGGHQPNTSTTFFAKSGTMAGKHIHHFRFIL